MPEQPDESKKMSGVRTFDELLKLKAEEAEKIGAKGAWNMARLRQLVHEIASSTPEPPARPPTIFVSYRWESWDHKNWVAGFVEDLKARGYNVYFDQDLQKAAGGKMPVPELISNVAQCNRFVFIWSPGYSDRIEANDEGRLQDGWVWDEYQVAQQLFKLKRILSFVCIWRKGDLPEWLSEDQVWDFRNDDQYHRHLDEAFPKRYVNIIGIRSDGSKRVIGPVELVHLNEEGRKLEASENFEKFLIEHL
jgi:hypothetical protein